MIYTARFLEQLRHIKYSSFTFYTLANDTMCISISTISELFILELVCDYQPSGAAAKIYTLNNSATNRLKVEIVLHTADILALSSVKYYIDQGLQDALMFVQMLNLWRKHDDWKQFAQVV